MSFKIVYTSSFGKEFKKLSSKYPSIKSDFKNLLLSLLENPEQGKALGSNCFKLRMAITSKGKGKSGGARIITCIKIIDELIFLISIYDKSDRESISDQEIKDRLKPYL
jgi:mRNA-degrading endonuclease RelE of RelBE toxin-antitoxin system